MDGGGPLISVVIPTHNAGSVVDACLLSLGAQSFKDFDVWVIDGMSSDDTVARCRSYVGKVGSALHIKQDMDQGVYDAMNIGVGLSRGKWIYFLGADDVLYDPGVFAEMAKYMKADDIEFLYGDVIYKNVAPREKNYQPNRRFGGIWSIDRLVFKGNICHQAIFYKRQVFREVGGFNLRFPIWADWDLNIRCFRHPGIQTVWVDRVVAIYNNHSGLSRKGDPVFRGVLKKIRWEESQKGVFNFRGVVNRLCDFFHIVAR